MYQLLLPIFEEWTYSTMNQLPLVRPVSPPLFDDFRAPMSFDQTLFSGAPTQWHSPAPVAGSASSWNLQPLDPFWSRPQSSVNSVLVTLVNVCQANQETMRMLVEEVRTLRREVESCRAAGVARRHPRSVTVCTTVTPHGRIWAFSYGSYDFCKCSFSRTCEISLC